jgi:hypothetical protein
MKLNFSFSNKVIRNLLALGGILISTQVFALPQDWTKYLECTKNYEQENKTGGHFETVVAEKVYYTCFSNAPDPFRTPAEFGPITASPDTKSPSDLSCGDEINSAIQAQIKFKTDLINKANGLKNNINLGKQSLGVTDATTASLRHDSEAYVFDCNLKKTRYFSALQKQIKVLNGACQKLKGGQAQDCFDGVVDQADSSPSVTAVKDASDSACNLSSIMLSQITRSEGIATALRNDLVNWQNQLSLLDAAKRVAIKKLSALELVQKDCPKP